MILTILRGPTGTMVGARPTGIERLDRQVGVLLSLDYQVEDRLYVGRAAHDHIFVAAPGHHGSPRLSPVGG
jgi:hypothetical protein